MATAPVPSVSGQRSPAIAGPPPAGGQVPATDAAFAPRFPELYAPGAPFAGPELQSLAADGLLARFHQHGYTLPGVPASPKLRARAAAAGGAPGGRARGGAGGMSAAGL